MRIIISLLICSILNATSITFEDYSGTFQISEKEQIEEVDLTKEYTELEEDELNKEYNEFEENEISFQENLSIEDSEETFNIPEEPENTDINSLEELKTIDINSSEELKTIDINSSKEAEKESLPNKKENPTGYELFIVTVNTLGEEIEDVLVFKKNNKYCIDSILFNKINIKKEFLPKKDIIEDTEVNCFSEKNDIFQINLNTEEEILKLDINEIAISPQEITNRIKRELKFTEEIPLLSVGYSSQYSRTKKTDSYSVTLTPSISTKYGRIESEFLINEKKSKEIATTYTYDDKENKISYSIGDFVSSSNKENFGITGLKIEKDYRLDPDFITIPSITFEDKIALPSTLDIYVNNKKVLQKKIKTGILDLDYYLQENGLGEVKIEIIDKDGKRKVVIFNIYKTEALLKEGLSSYSVSVGKLKKEHHKKENIYLGKFKHGLTNHLTAGVEYLQIGERKYSSININTTLLKYFVLFLKTGRDNDNNSWNEIKITKNGKDYDYLFSYETADNLKDFSKNKSRIVASIRYKNLGLNYIKSKDYNNENIESYGVSWSNWLYRSNLQYTKSDKEEKYSGEVTIRDLPKIEAEITGRIEKIKKSGKDEIKGSLLFVKDLYKNKINKRDYQIRSLIGKENKAIELFSKNKNNLGLDYSLGVLEKNKDKKGYITTNYTGSKFNLSNRLTYDNNDYSLNTRLNGSINYLEGETALSRNKNTSFVYVETKNAPHTMIKVNGNDYGETDNSGKILVAGLSSYSKNKIEVDYRGEETIDFNTVEQVVVPGRNTGHKLVFEGTEYFEVKFKIEGTGLKENELNGAEFIAVNQKGEEISGIVGNNKIGYIYDLKDKEPLTIKFPLKNSEHCSFKIDPKNLQKSYKCKKL
jgi:outer membrane usher protein